MWIANNFSHKMFLSMCVHGPWLHECHRQGHGRCVAHVFFAGPSMELMRFWLDSAIFPSLPEGIPVAKIVANARAPKVVQVAEVIGAVSVVRVAVASAPLLGS